jgi:hypothetical protein
MRLCLSSPAAQLRRGVGGDAEVECRGLILDVRESRISKGVGELITGQRATDHRLMKRPPLPALELRTMPATRVPALREVLSKGV